MKCALMAELQVKYSRLQKKLYFAKIKQVVGVKRKSFDAYIIRNARHHSDWSETTRHALEIAQKEVSLLVNYNGPGDLYKTFMHAKR